MRFGVNTFLFASPFTDRDVKLFCKFREWGFDSVEIAIEEPRHITPKSVKRALDRAGLVCGSISACFGPGRDLRGAASAQKSTMDYMSSLLDQMVTLDCRTIIGPLYSCVGRADSVPSAEYRRQWKTVVRNLRVLCQKAEALGQQICLEPLNRYETDFINTCDRALHMIHDVDSPALKILLDTFHMNIEEKSPADAIRRAGRHLGHLHACGSDRGTPGNDHTDWKAIACALADIKYQGDIVIESFTPDVKIIARAAAIWRRIEPTRDEIAVKGLKFLRNALNQPSVPNVQIRRAQA
jgi:D-psicose/D-tagatose/L-ribulose 3-epimerase